MGDYSVAYVTFDTAKLRSAVSIAENGRAGEVRFLGEIENTEAATVKLVQKLASRYRSLTFCYEAGPTGYELYRLIKRLGHDCLVAAPSLIPRKAGDRVKTNRRDALSLAKLLRAGKPRPGDQSKRLCDPTPYRISRQFFPCVRGASHRHLQRVFARFSA